jgi:hypothetical protein
MTEQGWLLLSRIFGFLGRHASEHFASGGFAFAIAKSEKCRDGWRGERLPRSGSLAGRRRGGCIFETREVVKMG